MQQISNFKKTEIGEIPEDWQIVKLRDVCDILDGKRIPIEESKRNKRHGKYPYYGASGVIDYVDNYIFDERLICLAEDGENLRSRVVPVAFIIEGKTWVNNHAHVLRPKKESLDHFYFNYFLNHIKYDKYLSFTAQPKLNQDNMKFISVILPSVREQQKIASILSKLDDLLKKTTQIIEQTQRLKKGLMQTLLTKGIGHTKFKKTEIGEIPEGWSITILEDLCEKISVGIATSTTKYFAKTGVPLLRNQNIKEDYIDIEDLIYITEDFAKINSTRALKAGDVICVRTGYPGQSAVVGSNMTGWQTFTTLIIRPLKDKIDSYYLSRFLNSIVKTKIMRLQAGGSQQNLNAGWLSKIYIKLPSLEEQQKIAFNLSYIDSLIENQKKWKREVANLKKGLMQKLLTGRIRVKV